MARLFEERRAAGAFVLLLAMTACGDLPPEPAEAPEIGLMPLATIGGAAASVVGEPITISCVFSGAGAMGLRRAYSENCRSASSIRRCAAAGVGAETTMFTSSA